MQPKAVFAWQAGVVHSFVQRYGLFHAVKVRSAIGACRKMFPDLAASGRVELLIKVIADVQGNLLAM